MITVQLKKDKQEEPIVLHEIAPSFYVAENTRLRVHHPFALPEEYIPNVSSTGKADEAAASNVGDDTGRPLE